MTSRRLMPTGAVYHASNGSLGPRETVTLTADRSDYNTRGDRTAARVLSAELLAQCRLVSRNPTWASPDRPGECRRCPTPSINASAHRAQVGSRAAEPPSVRSGTLDAAEHGGSIPVDGVETRKCWRLTGLNRERPRPCESAEVGSLPVQRLDASLVRTGRSDRRIRAIHATAVIKRCQQT
jgi:hypothetical protein